MRGFGVYRRGLAVCLAALLVLSLAGPLAGCSAQQPQIAAEASSLSSGSTASTDQRQESVTPAQEPVTVTFCAVGDNLIHGSVYRNYANGDGTYDFTGAYEHTAEYIQSVDVAYINQETVCGGSELGLSDYPVFNSPHEVITAVADAGFDWISTSSNHAYDYGEEGIISQLDFIEADGRLIQTGTNDSWEAAAEPRVLEVKGVRFGLASYTYGLNGFELPAGQEYLVNLIDRDRIAEDVALLNEVSDVQIVSMHWGVEYVYEPTAEQVELAYFLSDLGVDVIIGSHPHVVEPTTFITGDNGQRTLVIYSLGNFLSAQDEPERMLGEMTRWSVTYDFASGEATVGDVEIWPTVNHLRPGWVGHSTYLLKDYDDSLAAGHMLAGSGLSRQYLISLAEDVFGDEFPIIY